MNVPSKEERHRLYWEANVRLVLGLLVVWWLVSYGAGVLFVPFLNEVNLPGTGFPLGFWFSQQGSIFVFVGLIFFYVWRMNKLEESLGLSED